MAVAPLAQLQDELAEQLSAMCTAAATAMRRATVALRDDRERLAAQVRADDARIDALREDIERTARTALTLHSPVAGDLRWIVSALRCADDVERMGDLAAHVASAVLRGHAVPPEIGGMFVAMGRTGADMADKTARVARTHNVLLALELRHDDDAIDAQLRQVFELLLAPSWTHGVGAAVDVTLLARYLERFADHAVSVADAIVYSVTGNDSARVEETLGAGVEPVES